MVTEIQSSARATQKVFPIAVACWAVVSLIALTTVVLILAAPLAEAHDHPLLASAIYKTFSFVCHQIPERSFHLANYKFAVCSRCTGLYAGFAIDFGLGYFSIWENTHLSRFVTGALLSSVAVFYVMPGLIDLSNLIGRRINGKMPVEIVE